MSPELKAALKSLAGGACAAVSLWAMGLYSPRSFQTGTGNPHPALVWSMLLAPILAIVVSAIWTRMRPAQIKTPEQNRTPTGRLLAIGAGLLMGAAFYFSGLFPLSAWGMTFLFTTNTLTFGVASLLGFLGINALVQRIRGSQIP